MVKISFMFLPVRRSLYGMKKPMLGALVGVWMATAMSSLWGANRIWVGSADETNTSFFDDSNWNQPFINGADGFQIDTGTVVIGGYEDEFGQWVERVVTTAGNNYVGFQASNGLSPVLHIAKGGKLVTSERVSNGQGGWNVFELFVGRGISQGSSNVGQLLLEDGGTLSLAYHLAVGRNSGVGTILMTGGLLERLELGNLYLGWDSTANAQLESYGGFVQLGGEVKLGGGYVYMGTQAAANAVGSRGYLELRGDSVFEAAALFAGRQGLGSSGTIHLYDEAILRIGQFSLGGENDNYHGAYGVVNMTDRSQVIASSLAVGDGIGVMASEFNQDGGTVAVTELRIGRNGGTGVYELTKSAQVTASAAIQLGQGIVRSVSGEVVTTAGDGTLLIDHTAHAKANVAYIGNGATGLLHVKGGTFEVTTAITLGLASTFRDQSNQVIGVTAAGYGTLRLDNGLVQADLITVGSSTGSGKLIQNGGEILTNQTLNIGHSAQQVGEYVISGGTLKITRNDHHLEVGRDSQGTLTMTGGGITVGGSVGVAQMANGRGNLTMSGGQIQTLTGTGFYIGEGGVGSLTMSGDALIIINPASANGLTLGRNTGSSGEVFLNGGTIRTNVVKKINGTGKFYFNGGVLQASAHQENFVQSMTRAEVQIGGAILDTQSFNVTLSQALLTGGVNDGGLQKRGAGTLTLNASNTFVGKTEVRQGILKLDHRDALAKSAWVEVKSGATLNVSTLELPANFVVDAVISGSGTLMGALTVKSGQKVKIGDSGAGATRSRAGELIGQLKVNQLLTLQGGASLEFGIGQVQGQKGTAWDHMVLSEAAEAVLTDTQRVILAINEVGVSGFDATQNYTWELMKSSTGSLGLTASQLQLDMSGWQSDASQGAFSLNFTDPSALRLEYQFLGTIPEPKMAMLSLLGLLAIFGQRRRSRV